MAQNEPQSPPIFPNVDVSMVPPPILIKEAMKTEDSLQMIDNLIQHALTDAHRAGSAKRQLNRIIIMDCDYVIVKTVEELDYADKVAPRYIPFYVHDTINPIILGKLIDRADSMESRTVYFPDVSPPTPPRPAQRQNHP